MQAHLNGSIVESWVKRINDIATNAKLSKNYNTIDTRN